VSDIWNSAAPGWAAYADVVDEQLAAATAAMLDAARIGPGDAILDLATGPGGAGLAAHERVQPGGSVVLSDGAGEMVAVAARRASGLEQVAVAVFDQDAIEAEDASFDAVINRHGLMFVDEPARTVAEAVRVLRGGGRYAAMTWDRRERNPWLGLVLDAVGEQFGVPFPPPNVRGPFTLDDVDALRGVLEQGGLREVMVAPVPTPMHAPSIEQWWERVPQLAGPLAMALAGMEPEVRDSIAERAMRFAREAALYEDGRIVLAGSSLIAVGTKP
jgi:SAM-dependent methyltransferase